MPAQVQLLCLQRLRSSGRLHFPPNRRLFCCYCSPPDSMLPARLSGPVSRSADRSASALSEVSNHPRQLKKADGLEAGAAVFGRSHPPALLGWRNTKVYTGMHSTPTARVPKDKVR